MKAYVFIIDLPRVYAGYFEGGDRNIPTGHRAGARQGTGELNSRRHSGIWDFQERCRWVAGRGSGRTRGREPGGGISGMDKADGCADCALPYVSRISERAAHVCATLRICNEKKKEHTCVCMCVCIREREKGGEDIIGFWAFSELLKFEASREEHSGAGFAKSGRFRTEYEKPPRRERGVRRFHENIKLPIPAAPLLRRALRYLGHNSLFARATG